MIGQTYEMHIQCVCGGTLIIISTPSDEAIMESLQNPTAPVWSIEETLSFKHKGNFGPSCLERREKVLESLRKEMITRTQGLLGTFISQSESHEKHG